MKAKIDLSNFRAIFKPRGLENISLGIKILAVLATLAVVAWGANTVTAIENRFASKISDFEKKTVLNQESTSGSKTQKNTELQAAQFTKIFGNIGTKSDNKNQKPAESNLPLSLIGVFLPEGEDSYAIIQDDKKNIQDVFSKEDSIFGAARLVKIFTDKVEIDRNGIREFLVIDLSTPAKSDSSGAVAGSEDTFVVDEVEIDKALENLPLLLTQARAVPYFKDGKAVGLRMFAIRTGSLFEKIGLQNGDVLKTVNGNSLADLSQAMQLFQKLKEERGIDLTLERNSAEKQFKYQIR